MKRYLVTIPEMAWIINDGKIIANTDPPANMLFRSSWHDLDDPSITQDQVWNMLGDLAYPCFHVR